MYKIMIMVPRVERPAGEKKSILLSSILLVNFIGTLGFSMQGFASSSGSLASIIGLIAGGILYGLIGSGAFLVTVVIIFVMFSMFIRLLYIREMTA